MQIFTYLLAAPDFAPIVQPILDVLSAILGPGIAIIGAIGTIYSIPINL